MVVMKKKKAIIAVLVIAFITSYILCGTGQNDADIDSIKIEEYTAILENRISLDSVVGTYCGGFVWCWDNSHVKCWWYLLVDTDIQRKAERAG